MMRECANRTPARSQGFTLIEILITMTILSILLMVAVPFYQDNRIRVKVAGEVPLVAPVQNRVTEAYYIDGMMPIDNASAGVGAKESYKGRWLASIEVGQVPVDGSITVSFDNVALSALGTNNTVIYYPVITNGTVAWFCDKGSMLNKYRPKECRF